MVLNHVKDRPAYCCTSPRALCQWGIAFAIFYAIGLAVVVWLHLEAYELAMLFAALGLACFANLARNRTFHCVITGPFFLLIALVIALSVRNVWIFPRGLLWTGVGIVVCAAFVLERRFAS